MTLVLETNNLADKDIDKHYLWRVVQAVLKACRRSTEVKISLVFLDKQKIHSLNKNHRGQNGPTNILSFATRDDKEIFKGVDSRSYLGEIVLCPDVIAQEAKKFGISFYARLTRVLAHGILHLLGYQHKDAESSRVMFTQEDQVVNDLITSAPKQNFSF